MTGSLFAPGHDNRSSAASLPFEYIQQGHRERRAGLRLPRRQLAPSRHASRRAHSRLLQTELHAGRTQAQPTTDLRYAGRFRRLTSWRSTSLQAGTKPVRRTRATDRPPRSHGRVLGIVYRHLSQRRAASRMVALTGFVRRRQASSHDAGTPRPDQWANPRRQHATAWPSAVNANVFAPEGRPSIAIREVQHPDQCTLARRPRRTPTTKPQREVPSVEMPHAATRQFSPHPPRTATTRRHPDGAASPLRCTTQRDDSPVSRRREPIHHERPRPPANRQLSEACATINRHSQIINEPATTAHRAYADDNHAMGCT